jgi:diacylglycerol kinase (ATP)
MNWVRSCDPLKQKGLRVNEDGIRKRKYLPTAVQWALLIGSSLLVLITELLNSAVEKVVDRIGTEHHILSKQAKDLGSAAAAVSMLAALMVWGLITYERFMG